MSNEPKDTPTGASDHTIDSIIEEARFLSEQEKMAKEAARLSGGPKMEEIYSNKSKEVRLTNQSPLDVESEDTPVISEGETAPEAETSDEEGTQAEEEVDTVVTLSPEYDEDTTISEDIIDEVDSFKVRSIQMKDVDTIDIDLDEEGAEDTESAPEKTDTSSEEGEEDDGLSNFERLFGKPKPVGAVQTVVSKVPVYQHESRVEKVHVRAGKFSAVVENEYKKYLASPNPVISQTLKPEKEASQHSEDEKPTPKKIAAGIIGRIVSFFSSNEEDENDDFRD